MAEENDAGIDDIASRLDRMSRSPEASGIDDPDEESKFSKVNDPIITDPDDYKFINDPIIPRDIDHNPSNINPHENPKKKHYEILDKKIKKINEFNFGKDYFISDIIDGPSRDDLEKLLDLGLDKGVPPKDDKDKEINIDTLERGVRQADETSVRLSDVIGQPQAVVEARKLVAQIKNPEIFRKWGAPTSPGLLLHGPPGTGKTLIAQAIAGETGAAFTLVKSSDVFGMWVGQSEKQASAIFELAREQARKTKRKVVIFFDEVEAVVPAHIAVGDPVGGKVRHEILQQMQGFKGRDEDIIVIASTNHPDMVDAAFRSRLGTWIEMELPHESARKELFEQFIGARVAFLAREQDIKLSVDIDYERLVTATDGLSHRDISQLAERVLIDKAYEEAETGKQPESITTDDVLSAIASQAKVMQGKRPNGF